MPLAEELDTVSEYLAIEQARFGDRLQVSIDVPSEVRSLFVPPLVLQPLIENAIRHGISRSSKSGRIRVAARTDGQQLVVDVEDDGPGLTRDRSSRGTGTGHSNLRMRLQELYGDAGDLIVSTGPNGGYTASVAMPVRTEANGDPHP